MNDVSQWLSQLGMSEYVPLFKKHAICWELLANLTNEDLIEIGVNPLGHRKRILRAAAGSSGPLSPRNGKPNEAERRQVTFLFCDIVDSTVLAEKLDPEDLRDFYNVYQEICGSSITRFRGHLAEYRGDGVVAYFGYPRAQEDAAQLAAQAALDILQSVSKIRHTKPDGLASRLHVRVGLSTGLVVIGDVTVMNSIPQWPASGVSPTLAARLQGLAPPDTIVIDSTTRQLIEGKFECISLGLHELKGFSTPLPVWKLQAASTNQAGDHQLKAPPSLVGREPELDLIAAAWERVQRGEGQALIVSGEPGIGKSALCKHIRHQFLRGNTTYLAYQCSKYHTSSAFYPIINQIESIAGFDSDDSPQVKLDKLSTLQQFSSEGNSASSMDRMAYLLSISLDSIQSSEISPERRKELTLEFLLNGLLQVAAKSPVLVILEDAQWSDPTSLEYFQGILGATERARILFIVTHRPDARLRWTANVNVSEITLNRLNSEDTNTLVESLAAGTQLPPAVQAAIVRRTDGVPLFVEELTKLCLDVVPIQNCATADPDFAEESAIPATLNQSLGARLDSLKLGKELAQIGAVIGREFSYHLLSTVSEMHDPEFGRALDELVLSGLVVPPEETKGGVYIFKHALIQEVAYQSLLRARRKELHLRVAHVTEVSMPEQVANYPDQIARHFMSAGMSGKAIEYWLKAAKRSIRQSAYLEAENQLKTAIQLVDQLPATKENLLTHVEALSLLGITLATTGGYSSLEVGAAYSKAGDLCVRIGDRPQLMPILNGQYRYYYVRAEIKTALELASKFHSLAQSTNTVGLIANGHRTLGMAYAAKGDFELACENLEKSIQLCAQSETEERLSVTAADPASATQAFYAIPLWCLGEVDQAIAHSEQALQRARRIGHPFSAAHALSYSTILCQFTQNIDALVELADECLAIASEGKFEFWLAGAKIMRGWALTMSRRSAEGIRSMLEGMQIRNEIGARIVGPYYKSLLADAYMRTHQLDEADELLCNALEDVNATGERWWEAELHRMTGDILLFRSLCDESRAEERYVKAMTISREQNAKSLERRSALSLAAMRKRNIRPNV